MKIVTRQRQESFIWNALSSIITALSSVILLMIVKRAAGIELGAYYSIAVAVANVLINIGHLNSFGFQISDVTEKFSFRTYLTLRRISILMMLAVAVCYIALKEYVGQKAIIVFLYCVYRAIYAYADVFQARYQQKGRVDLAAKLQFFKVLLPDTVLATVVLMTHKVEYAICIAMLVEIIYLLQYNRVHCNFFDNPGSTQINQCMELFRQCVPLFFSAFATAYILNSSKYSIDKLLDSKSQIYYAILLLPATTVHMIAGFVYRPILTDLAVDWAKGRMKHLKKQIFRIMLVIMVGTIAVEALSGTVILPVLEWLYAVKELEHYRSEFCIMLMAGGLNAGVTFMGFMITIMRKQNHMIWIYAITFTAALFVPDIFVKRYQFMGAAVSFLVLIFLQFFMLLFVYLGGLKINEKGDWDS